MKALEKTNEPYIEVRFIHGRRESDPENAKWPGFLTNYFKQTIPNRIIAAKDEGGIVIKYLNPKYLVQ